MSTLPPDHPQRLILANEIHARPPVALQTPERATYVAVVIPQGERQRESAHLAELCRRFGVAAPAESANHLSAPFGPIQIKWERHGEFSGYTFYAPGRSPKPFSAPATSFLPEGWLAGLPGTTIVAAHAALIPAAELPPDAEFLAQYFGPHPVVGAEIGDGVGYGYSAFRVHEDGFSRFLVLDRSFSPRQAGRMLQRLFEIEAYRTMALLALPLARQQTAQVQAIERALAGLTEHIAKGGEDAEPLLAELTKMAAEVESALTASMSRYAASLAYYELVRARFTELHERRLPGVQPIEEFLTRRMAPAIETCRSASQRLRNLSERVSQTSGLLSTRVEIARAKQNQDLLASMNRRAMLQLRLQQTVEGLSVAAITYYVVGLVGFAAEAIEKAGLNLDASILKGVSIPAVAALVWLAVRRAKREIAGWEGGA